MITATVLGLYWLSTFYKECSLLHTASQHQYTINQLSNFPKLAVWRCLLVQNPHTAHPQTKFPASSKVCCTKDNVANGNTSLRTAKSEGSQKKFFP